MVKSNKHYRIALLGNPNAGKTTLFNALTGLTARVGNYPGITVELREGTLNFTDFKPQVTLIDLPGTYSLLPRSDDESVTVKSLFSLSKELPPIDLVIAVVDVTHLKRNLYLIEQLLNLKAPMLIALSMTDVLEDDGFSVDSKLLSERLNRVVIKASGQRKEEVQTLKNALFEILQQQDSKPETQQPSLNFSNIIKFYKQILPQSKRLQYLEELAIQKEKNDSDGLIQIKHKTQKATDSAVQLDQIQELYQQIEEHTQGVIQKVTNNSQNISEHKAHDNQELATPSSQKSDRLDAAFLHPFFGPLLFLAIFMLIFQALFTWAAPLMDGLSTLVALFGQNTVALLPESMPLLRSLWLDGIVGGVGNVVVFIPQIAILFFAISMLEDSGLLARVAFLLDRLMSKVGLHGRAFVPFLSGFACAIPAIMATRTIENERDRLTTIMVTPLISCSARLPVYSLLIATIFSSITPIWGFIPVGSAILFFAYTFSLVSAITVAFVLKKTLLKSPLPDFVLELPTLRSPNLKEALRISSQKAGQFLKDAGTIIFAMSILLWGLFTFPQNAELKTQEQAELQINQDPATEIQTAIQQKYAALNLENSFAGKFGKIIEPTIRPLGFDWKIGIGLLASFAAREVFVSSMGLVYGLGDGQDEQSISLKEKMLKERHKDNALKPVYTPLTGLSLLMFFLLAMQCMSTLAATKRETNSYKWPLFQFAYMSSLAYLSAFIVYQGGLLLGYS